MKRFLSIVLLVAFVVFALPHLQAFASSDSTRLVWQVGGTSDEKKPAAKRHYGN